MLVEAINFIFRRDKLSGKETILLVSHLQH
jgi:hypothetical protein